MTSKEFDQLLTETLAATAELLRTKGADYASDVDRLSNFKEAAAELSAVSVNPELAWAAGFYDGEGSTNAYGSVGRAKTPRMKVGQVERGPLERFQKALDMGSVKGPYKQGVRQSDIYIWEINGTYQVFDALKKLWPYLGEVKKQQALATLEKAHNSRSGTNDGRTRAFPDISELETQLRITPFDVWAIYAQKHWNAINSFVRNNGQVESEPIESRIYDIINYSFLLLGLIEDAK